MSISMKTSLTSEICRKVVENKYKNAKVNLIEFVVRPFSEDIEGYMGEHFKILIKFELNGRKLSEEFFMKAKPTKNKIQQESVEEAKMFTREIFLYDVIFKEFEKCGFDLSFTPKCYYCIPDEALILENLQIRGFEVLNRNGMFKLEEMKGLLKSLGLYHAAGFAYERKKSKELGREFNIGDNYAKDVEENFFMHFFNPKARMMKFWYDIYEITLKLIDEIPSKDQKFKEHFKTIFANFEFGKIFVQNAPFVKTLGHGDLWANNLMFRTTQSEIECKLVDFQLQRYFYPTFDVSLAIYFNTNKDFRDKHLKELLEFYYTTVSITLQKYKFDIKDIFPEDDFHQSLRYVKADAMLQVLMINAIVHIPKSISKKHAQGEDGMDKILFDNKKITEETFKTNDIYKNILLDNFLEMYDAICTIIGCSKY